MIWMRRLSIGTRLGGSADLLEGGKALQRDLDWMDQCAKASCMRFNKAKNQVLPFSLNKPTKSYRPRAECLESTNFMMSG